MSKDYGRDLYEYTFFGMVNGAVAQEYEEVIAFDELCTYVLTAVKHLAFPNENFFLRLTPSQSLLRLYVKSSKNTTSKGHGSFENFKLEPLAKYLECIFLFMMMLFQEGGNKGVVYGLGNGKRCLEALTTENFKLLEELVLANMTTDELESAKAEKLALEQLVAQLKHLWLLLRAK
ncbi:hypothetical protein ACFE04_021990 [Oxalis oulophora]